MDVDCLPLSDTGKYVKIPFYPVCPQTIEKGLKMRWYEFRDEK
jgi:hypothetical protein